MMDIVFNCSIMRRALAVRSTHSNDKQFNIYEGVEVMFARWKYIIKSYGKL